MPSTYSSRLRIENIGNGEQSGTWGDTVDTSLGTIIEEAIAGVASVTHDDSANYTLTTANGATDEARQAVLEISGTLTANRNVVCPTQEKTYIIKNGTSGGFSVTLKTSGGAGIAIPNGDTMVVYCDGTNVVDAITNLSAGVTLSNVAIVDLSSTQTLTNKTISADSNTLSGIAASSFVLSNGSGNIDGAAAQKAIPSGVVVGTTDTQTLTNKTISADNNTISGMAASSFALTDGSGNLDGAAAQKVIPAGAVVGTTDTQTLTNKTFDLTNNTLTGTTAEFNSAVSDGSFATTTGTETLTNKTITQPSLVLEQSTNPTPTAEGEIWWDTDNDEIKLGNGAGTSSFSHNAGGATLTNKTIALGSNTISGTFAQFNTAVTDAALANTAGSQTLTNKTISADNNTLSGFAASSFALTNGSGNLDGAAAQKAIPSGVVVGTTDTQTLTNKTLTTPVLTLTQSAAPTPTAEGRIEWDTDGNFIVVGDGSGTQTFPSLSSTHTLTNKTLALGSNTVSGTLAQFNTALTDADFQAQDAVLDDLAALSVTKGNIFVANTTDYTSLAVGTNDQVLTADSAQATGVKWADPPSGGLVHIETQSVSSSVASINFETGIDGTYDVYELFISNVTVVTDDVQLWMRFGTGGGPTYDSGANYNWAVGTATIGGTLGVGAAADNQINLTHTAGTDGIGNAANESGSFVVTIHNPAAAVYTETISDGSYDYANGKRSRVDGAGVYKSVTAVTAIQILAETGNIDGGEFSLYGIRKS